MSENEKLENMKLDDEAIENVAGGNNISTTIHGIEMDQARDPDEKKFDPDEKKR